MVGQWLSREHDRGIGGQVSGTDSGARQAGDLKNSVDVQASAAEEKREEKAQKPV